MKDRSRNTRLAPARPLVAWFIDDVDDETNDDEGQAELVYAYDEREARKIAAPWFDREAREGHLNCRRVPECDSWARLHRRHETRLEPMRLAGFREEGDSGCATCGLADISGRRQREEWRVCHDCGECGECGHSSDCGELPAEKALPMLKADLAKHRAEWCAKTRPDLAATKVDPSLCYSCDYYERLIHERAKEIAHAP